MRDGGPGTLTGWRMDRRTFMKVLGLTGIGLAAAGALGTGLRPLITPALAQTSPVDDLALRLQFDRERIFRFVAEQIRYQPYAGLLRGPAGTLMSRAGNSVDQAALLAALLRASGHEARFAHGPLDALAADALLAAAAIDPEMARRQLADSLTGRGEGGRPLAAAEPDPATRALLDLAAARVEETVSWARDQLLQTSQLIERVLADDGIVLSSQTSPLPMPERDDHVWVQVAAGPAWLDLDPSLPGLRPGDAGAPVASTHQDPPDELRHGITFRVISEVAIGGRLAEETLLEVDRFADELADRPIGILNAHHSGLKALGADISAGVEGGTKYLPGLILGDEVIIGPGVLRFGQPEGDPFGQLGPATPDPVEGEPIAEWVEITISSPGSQPTTIRREMFDRLGAAARSSDRPDLGSLGPAELVALDADGTREFMPAQRTHWLTVNTGVVGGEELQRRLGGSTLPQFLPGLIDAYHVMREATGVEIAVPMGVDTFVDRPNLVSLTIDQELGADGALRLRSIADIWHRSLGAIPVMGASADAVPAIVAGVLPHLAERLFVGENLAAFDGPPSPSVGSIFDAARRAGTGIRLVRNEEDVADLGLPPAAAARLVRSISTGSLAIVPERPVDIDGRERRGWWLIDPATQHVRDELDDGGGASGAETGVIVEADAEALPPLRRLGNCAAHVLYIAAPIIVGFALSTSDDPARSGFGLVLALGGIGEQAAAQWGLPPNQLPPGMFGC